MTAQQTMVEKYGEPSSAYDARWCIMWQVQQDFPWFLEKEIFINKDFKVILFNGFKAVEVKGLQTEIKSYDGVDCRRPIRGANVWSMHAWNAAIDLNRVTGHMIEGVPVEKITQQMRMGPWTQDFINCMTSAGAFFGGNFIHRPDPMHFSLMDM